MRYYKSIATVLLAGALMPPGNGYAADDLESQVEAARGDVVSAMKDLGVSDADIEVSLPVAPVLQAVAAINAAPAGQRTIHVRSTAANGKFWEDGPTWCNSFLELGYPDGFQADAVLANFAPSFPNPNTMAISADVNVRVNVKAHWHFKGRRTGLFNACPPGGGFGGIIGANGNTQFKVTGHLDLIQDGGNFRYQVSVVDPPKVNMTISIGFQGIGNLGIPQSFDLPLGVVASGPLPLMIANKGEVTLPGGQKRTYSISLAPKRVSINQSAAIGAWTGKVEVAPGS
ncbi:hypothetical protein [Rhizobium sp. 42MFCr.1]|uniref:hypothetical protein n=1 Tax=Rhizobium sp. 42MFCr.1 TaxID=1048680 RepID=UPI00037B44EA|nr:hypothetical protein [Rhizobium sp. 42MFCr.1]